MSFPTSGAWKAAKKLQLIHTVVCGPMSEVSSNGNKYFLIFINDFLRMCYVYLLKQKSDVTVVFSKFKVMVKNQAHNRIKMVKSNSGTEYTAQKFEV